MRGGLSRSTIRSNKGKNRVKVANPLGDDLGSVCAFLLLVVCSGLKFSDPSNFSQGLGKG